MPYLKNTTDADLEIPSLGLVIPAGQAVEVDADLDQFADHPLLKVTKTKPAKTTVVESDDTNEGN